MSDLENVCDALGAIDADILRTSQIFHAKAGEYGRAAAQASSAARSAEGSAREALARTAAALSAASRHCAAAAQLLVGASNEGQAFVRRTVVVAQHTEDGRVRVISGVAPGDKVVVKGALLLDGSADQLL